MIDIFFFIFLLLYLVVGIKIDQWTTFTLLGFKGETPLGFMTNPRLYDLLRGLIFAITVACIFGATFAWYYGIGTLLTAWFATTWIGQRLAFNRFRAICLELAAQAETNDDRISALESARMSNTELRKMITLANKYG